MKALALISAMPIAAPAFCQSVIFSTAVTEQCIGSLSNVRDFRKCVGEAAATCMESMPEGWSTVGMVTCLEHERQYWDGKLNLAYKRASSNAKSIDNEAVALGSSVSSQADALRDMQRAWMAFRDATCIYEQSLWGGGSGGGPASVTCHMRLTAEQAIYLEPAGVGE